MAFVAAVAVDTASVSAQTVIDRQALVGLLQQERFDTLDRHLTALQRDYEAGKIGEHVVNRAFGAFAYSDPELLAQLDEWVRRMPNSYAALMARGVYSWHLAWLSRGERLAGATHPIRFAAMQKFTEAARIDVEAAVGLNGRIVKGHQVLMSLATLYGAGLRLWRRYLSGVLASPTAIALHGEMLWALQPKWAGSWVEIGAFRMSIRIATWFDPRFKVVKAQVYHQETELLNRRNQFQQALSLNEIGLRLHDAAYLHRQRASILAAMDQENAALDELREAAKLDPEDSDVDAQIGGVLLWRLRYEDALPHFNRALRNDPYHPIWLVRRARVLSELGDRAGAERDLHRAQVFGNFEPEVHAARGRYFQMPPSDMRKSAEAYKSATQLAPDREAFLLGYAHVLHALGDCEIIPVTRRYNEICKKRRTERARESVSAKG